MEGRVIAVGDIHGCLVAFQAILKAIEPRQEDVLVLLGDYVDRGPSSRQVIDEIIELRKACHVITLFGNHEEMMRDVVSGARPPYDWLRYGGVDTLDSYGFVGDLAVVPENHREFLASLVDSYETNTHFFVHANYDPNRDLNEQPAELLRWVKLSEFFPEPHRNKKIAVVGHTHHRKGEILRLPHLVCIDTYCYGGGWLTAYEIGSEQVWQANRDGELRPQDEVQYVQIEPMKSN
jgi:serine/threonine protein phosphatase 1